jgi:glycosyltransferase involved in cell wall biosynthesis
MQHSTKAIVHLIRQGKIGGGESHVLSLVSRLDPKKFRSIVISFTDGPMINALNELGIKNYVVPTTTPFNPLVKKKVTRILREEKVDIVHAHGTRAASNVFRSASELNVPMVYTVHGWSYHKDQGKLLFTARNTSERFLVSKAKHTICVSEANKAEGLSYFPMNSVSVIHNGVDFSRFNPTNDSRDKIREECGIPTQSFCIAYIVRMTVQKDPLNMVRAAAIAAEKDANLHFLMAGDGPLLEKAKQLSQELNVYHRISFPGFRTDVPELLSACDAYALSSLWEGLPIGIIEAMGMEKPCVVSDIAANAELIEDNKHGYLVPMRNPQALAQGLLKLSSNPKNSADLGKAASIKARKMFDLGLMTKRVERVYEDLLGLPISSDPVPHEPRKSCVE